MMTAGLEAKERRRAMVYEVKEPRSLMPLVEQVWMTFESPSFSPIAFWYAQFQLFIITFSTLTFTLETEINCKPFSVAEHGFVTEDNCQAWEAVWSYSEYVAVAVFTFELLCRFASSPSKLIFVQNTMNWVDLIAILPFFIELLVAAALPPSDGSDLGSGLPGEESEDSALSAFSVFRVVRLVRVFRIFKMGKVSGGMKMMAATMGESLKVRRHARPRSQTRPPRPQRSQCRDETHGARQPGPGADRGPRDRLRRARPRAEAFCGPLTSLVRCARLSPLAYHRF